METFLGIMIPFLGTTLGASCVFFMKRSLGDLVQRALAGFAAGVMVAASIWSLLIPAIEQSEGMGKLSFLPAFIGFWVGVLFLVSSLAITLFIATNCKEGNRIGKKRKNKADNLDWWSGSYGRYNDERPEENCYCSQKS